MRKPKSVTHNVLFSVVGLILALAVFAISGALPTPARLVAAVFTTVVFFWITEIIPLYVTALMGAVAIQLLLDPLAHLFGFEPYRYSLFMSPFASPVVILMFGGFFLARIFAKYNLDVSFANSVLTRLGSRPSVVLAGIMGLTAFLSMWMSNTATTAIMVAAMLPVVRKLPKGSPFARALMLGIPFSANIGGVGTPIGTPPNAIAIGLLADRGINVSFVQWVLYGVPPMLVLLILCWAALLLFFPPGKEAGDLRISTAQEGAASRHGIVYTTFALTVLLWLTDFWHGIPSAVVAMLPVLVFSVAGLSNRRDLRELPWEILLLIGGGIALGAAIQETGLSRSVVELLNLNALSPLMAGLIMGTLTALLATFMSHTASANLVAPIALSLSGADPIYFAAVAALSASYGMALPVSTPPNAIAYGSDMIAVSDMLKVGLLMTLFGVVLSLFYVYYCVVVFGA